MAPLSGDMFNKIIYMTLWKRPTHQAEPQRGCSPFRDESCLTLFLSTVLTNTEQLHQLFIFHIQHSLTKIHPKAALSNLRKSNLCSQFILPTWHTIPLWLEQILSLGCLNVLVKLQCGVQGTGEWRCSFPEDHFTPPDFFLIKISRGRSKSTSKRPQGKHQS